MAVSIDRRVEIVLLAAGASHRMGGRDKLLDDAGGQPLLRRTALVACSSMTGRVHAILPPGHESRRAVLEGLDLEIVENPDATEGMAVSIRCGIRVVSKEAEAAIIALADMPDVTARDYDRLIRCWRATGRICRAATVGGEPGNPVLFPRCYFRELARLAGDRGAHALLSRETERTELVKLEGNAARTDLDTPDDWRNWLTANAP